MSHCYRPLTFTEFKKYPETKYPWYRERLQLKYQKKNITNPPKFLLADDWKFLKDCSDDCRDGYPPPIDANGGIAKGRGSVFPHVFGETNDLTDKLPKIDQKSVPKRFSKKDVVFSKATPLKIQRQYNIEEIELGLIQHPLALYPHLEASLPSDIFEEIVDIIDPDMNIYAYDIEGRESSISQSNPSVKPGTANSTVATSQSESKLPLNSFKWVSKKEEKERLNSVQNEQKLKMLAENEHIKAITKEFCDWVAGLGGQVNSIEEPTVTSLFASGYETKPTLSVPIHVIELTSIPPELRGNVTAQNKPNDQDASESEPVDKIYKTANGDFQKFRYGSWYLPSKYWKKMPANEKLLDPKLLHNHKQEEHKAKVLSLNTELAYLLGPKLFDEFIEKSCKRKPKFLDEVAEIQNQIELEKKLLKEEGKSLPP